MSSEQRKTQDLGIFAAGGASCPKKKKKKKT